MAGKRVQGITIEIGGETTKLQTALKQVDSTLSKTQSSLKDVNRLLKLDPTNTELLSQKHKLLQQSITETKERLNTLKEADEQAKKQLEAGELGQDKYDALQREIIETEEKLKSLEEEAKKVPSAIGAKMEEAGKKISDVGDKISKVGDKVSGVGEGFTKNVTAPITALGAASVAAFNEVDAGMDIIVQKTGASGKALEEMCKSAENLATSIPTDFETAGAAIGEVNTRFGVTGKELEDLSGKFIKFADLNDTDVSSSIDNTQKVMAAFGLETKDAGAVLDTMNAVGQKTGISMDSLAKSMVTNAASLTEMGMSASDAAEFLGQCEMSGTDTTAVMAGLKKALANAAAEGKTLPEALSGFQDTMNSSKSETDKLNAAIDLFGAKAGPALYQACKDGSLSLNLLGTSLSDNLGSVEETFDNTIDPIDQFKMTMNQAKITGSDVGNSLATVLMPMLQKLSEGLKRVSEWFRGLSPEMQQNIVKFGMVAAAVGPVLVVIGKLITTVGTITSAIGTFTTFLGGITGAAGAAGGGIALFSGPLLPIVGIIGGVVAAGVLLYKNWDTIKETAGKVGAWVSEKWDGLKSATSEAWSNMTSKISESWSGIKANVSEATENIKSKVTEGWENLKSNTSEAWSNVKTKIGETWTGITTNVSEATGNVKSKVTEGWENLKTNTSEAWSNVKTKIGESWSGIKTNVSEATQNVKEKMTDGWNTLKNNTSTAWTNIKTTIDQNGGGIKGVITTAVQGYKSLWTAGFTELNTITGGKLGTALSTVQSKLSSIKEAFSSKMNSARDLVKSAIDKIKSFFNFSWSLPKLKMPHISISGKFSINPPSVPHFSISWYRKAMNAAYILNGASIFGELNGRMLGGGEAGSEMVVGTQHMMNMIHQATSQSNMAVVTAVNNMANRMIGVMTEYFPRFANTKLVLDSGTLVGEMAADMDNTLGKIGDHKGRNN